MSPEFSPNTEREAAIQKVSKEIELLEEDLKRSKKEEGRDKLTWALCILGVIFPAGTLFNVYDDITAGKADGITQVFLVLGIAGIFMLFYGLWRERRHKHHMGYLELKIEQKQRELYIFTTGKFY